jgi:hypothetical protein
MGCVSFTLVITIQTTGTDRVCGSIISQSHSHIPNLATVLACMHVFIFAQEGRRTWTTQSNYYESLALCGTVCMSVVISYEARITQINAKHMYYQSHHVIMEKEIDGMGLRALFPVY